MGAPMRMFRLVRAVGGNGCVHHLLLRAGRPSYPNADQGAEDAADALPDFLMEALTVWWQRWVLPAQCRWSGHEPGGYEVAVVAEHVTVVGPGSLDLQDEDVGMRSFDVWVAERRNGFGAVLAMVPDEAAFREAAEEETDGEVLGPPVRLRLLFLTEGSGDGDLRNV